MTAGHQEEVAAGSRFEFGANWARFLGELDEHRVQLAEQSLQRMLGRDRFDGLTLLDIGSGSGLFSLAAYRLGARVRSFDFDPQSVGCTQALRRDWAGDDPAWEISAGSVLDPAFMASLGTFDIVYSWGVLHHTGDMATGLAHAGDRVAPGGQLFVAIYNDQGRASRSWLAVKKAYNALPPALRFLVLWPCALRIWGPTMVRDLIRGTPFRTWRNYRMEGLRGMSPWHDVVDWVGGLPMEVAKPETLFRYYRDRGFRLTELTTAGGGKACNEYVFRHEAGQ